MERSVIVPEGWTGALPLSPAVRVQGIVYCSGQVGIDPKTGSVHGSNAREQTQQTLRNIEAVLKAAGSSLQRVDKCTVFLTRASDFDVMNEVFRQFFPADPPARSTVIVAALARPEFVVEIECIAHV